MFSSTPLNGALARLLCKIGLLISVLILFGWTIGQRRRVEEEKEELQGRFEFAQQQLSSLHAQIDVITRHKEKIEGLLEEEKAECKRTKNDLSERVANLEAENTRIGNTLALLNQTRRGTAAPPVERPNLFANRLGMPLTMDMMKKSPADAERPNPIVEPRGEGEKEEEEENGNKKMEKLEQKEEDPFGEKKNEGDEGGRRQIEAPKMEIKVEKEEEEQQEVEKRAHHHSKKEPNGGEKMGAAGEEEEENGKVKRRKTDGEEGEQDYVFHRPKPRQDLIFQRNETDSNKGGLLVMPGRELMRKLAEKEEQRRKDKEHQAIDDANRGGGL